jgi:predicted lipoprotein with Yx(FWY)xxD motif
VKLMPAMMHCACLSKLAGWAQRRCAEHGVQAWPHFIGARVWTSNGHFMLLMRDLLNNHWSDKANQLYGCED